MAIFEELFQNYPALLLCKKDILDSYDVLLSTYRNGGKVLVCGNGGSAADSEHIVGELMKGFNLRRPLTEEQKKMFGADEAGVFLASHLQGALPAISLVSETGLMTAFLNDVSPELIFAQQVFGYLKPGDTLIALSTSGNSADIVYAAKAALALGGKVVSITGKTGGKLASFSDALIRLPCEKPFAVQELTLPVYHALCAALEEAFFRE